MLYYETDIELPFFTTPYAICPANILLQTHDECSSKEDTRDRI